jgi:long-chain acyl-CoA synthetase
MLAGTWTIACSVNVTDAIIHVSHLPVAHILERLTLTVIMYRGGRIVFATERSIRAFEDMKLVHATAGPMIPSMLERFYSTVTSKGGTAMKLALGISRICRKVGFRSRLADAFVFNKVRAELGGRLEWFVVAGACFHREIHESLSAILDIELVTIYGLSEAGGAVSVTDRHSVEPGTVGQLAPGTQIRFKASGEILIKSRATFSGYWRDDKVYAESFEDGWFRSGDMGRVDRLGNLIVTGRAYDVLEYEPGVELAIPFLVMSYAKYMMVADFFITPFKEERALIGVGVTTKRWVEYATTTQGLTDSQAEHYAREKRFYE